MKQLRTVYFFSIPLFLTLHCVSTFGFDDKSTHQVGTETLTAKVMVGYQGWFNCEGDGAQLGWTHWARNRRQQLAPGNVTVDLWPDVTEYDDDELFETGFRLANGKKAKVFSSGHRQTVLRHFQWMRDYEIDGAFLQRFANGLTGGAVKRHKDNVLRHVREGANSAGRTYAVMYDLSGLSAGGTRIVQKDWNELRHKLKITEDSNYQFHNGNPVVAVWGIGFKSAQKPREYSLAECRELVEYLKSDGCTVMLGIPTGWRNQDRDSIDDPDLHELLKQADILSPWTIGRYRNVDEVRRHADICWQPDIQWCDDHMLDYMPVVFPGFSWHNLTGEQIDSIPRLKGDFLWAQIKEAKRCSCEMLYVAMFDEVDEGTAIFKCTNRPPTGEGVSFLTYEGLPSDHYLKIVGEAGKLLRSR